MWIATPSPWGTFTSYSLPVLIGAPEFLNFAVRPDGAFHQWREDPPRELSIALVADERFGWVTNRIEAS
jgi:hypothetical protein